ncbi:MAG: phosphatidate cytidylyltransferase [Anaerolineae bacterium]|nr:phosphatidate cytidylyltransferase [Anaerolineae bacterium]
MLENVWLALAITFLLALFWLRFNDFLAYKGIISGPLSRKIIHIGTGPVFVLCWLLFPPVASARFLAAIVPFLITLQFALVGLGFVKDQAAVAAMSRYGDPREILRGPLFYGVAFVVLTIIYWKTSLIGIVALMLMCGGDGLADIVGKKVTQGKKLPWSVSKSWPGTMAMFGGGLLLSLFMTAIYLWTGSASGYFWNYFVKIAVITLAATIVESLPYRDIDNLTVPLVAVFLGNLLKL